MYRRYQPTIQRSADNTVKRRQQSPDPAGGAQNGSMHSDTPKPAAGNYRQQSAPSPHNPHSEKPQNRQRQAAPPNSENSHNRQRPAPPHNENQQNHQHKSNSDKAAHPLTKFIPQSLYNPETGKILGFLSAEDLLIAALILLLIDSGSEDEDNTLLIYALTYILISEHIDLPV